MIVERIQGSVLLLAYCIGMPLCFAEPLRQGERPNVILILADDLGKGMLSHCGQKIVKTPNIDRIAEEGMSFSRAYGAVFCAPSRYTLLTGMHDGHPDSWGHTKGGLLIERDEGGITRKEFQTRMEVLKKNAVPAGEREVFLAQVAQQAGYQTAEFGKLDWGFMTWHERVTRHGWDHYEGYYSHKRCHGFYPPYLWRNGEKVIFEGNPAVDCKTPGAVYSQEFFIEGILNYLRKNHEQPFFLYHPTQIPHGDLMIPEIHPDFANHPKLNEKEKIYASMVCMLDDHVGLILDELKKLKIDDNTIVIFTVDNGHEIYYWDKHTQKRPGSIVAQDGSPRDLNENKFRTATVGDVFNGAANMAGIKFMNFEGSVHVPFFVRWPGKIQPGRVSDRLIALYDILPTLADICRVPSPEGKDGRSFYNELLGETAPEHEYVYIANHTTGYGEQVISRDGWKAVYFTHDKRYQLYNLFADPEERNDLSRERPEVLAGLIKIILQEKNSQRKDL